SQNCGVMANPDVEIKSKRKSVAVGFKRVSVRSRVLQYSIIPSFHYSSDVIVLCCYGQFCFGRTRTVKVLVPVRKYGTGRLSSDRAIRFTFCELPMVWEEESTE